MRNGTKLIEVNLLNRRYPQPVNEKMAATSLKTDYETETGAPVFDNLTGLFNHGFFQLLLERECKRSRRYDEPLSMVLMDIDGFKRYNRRNGPVAGDRVIIQLAQSIKEHVRDVDVVSRYSGNVFAIAFIKADTHGALVPVERIRKSIEHRFQKDLTVSVGLASICLHEGISPGKILMNNANEALINAKLQGRNQVCCFKKERNETPSEKSKILIVDDESRNLKLLEALLIPLKHSVVKASCGADALSVVGNVDVDLILLDIMMPDMDGYEVCRRLKESEATRNIPVVMVTALDDMESKVRAIEAGADDFLTKPINRVELLARTRSLIKLRKLNRKFISIENILFSLANAVEAKDIYTQGHVDRVSNLAVSLGRKMKCSEQDLESLWYGGALHDIGKIKIAETILNKPDKLDTEEFNKMQEHADAGYKICLPLEKVLGPALEIIRHHHEKLDGTGYPDGLVSDEISMTNRIMAVVDIYDALVTDRPYRKQMPREKAFRILLEEAGNGKIDGAVVESLISMVN
jgi:putative two-component system response regulator